MYFTTATGLHVYPETPEAVTIRLADIAHSLGMICRFGGHCRVRYSVAEHSINVLRCVLWLARDESPRVRYELARAALMHDAAEAYVGDLPSPFKKVLPEYKALERRFEAKVREAFDLWDGDPRIKDADLRVLAAEAKTLLPGELDGWNDPALVREPWAGFRLYGWHPGEAERHFLQQAKNYGITDVR